MINATNNTVDLVHTTYNHEYLQQLCIQTWTSKDGECLPATSRHTSHVNWFWTTETTCKGSCQNETPNKDKTSETFLFNGVNYWVHSENATDGMKQQIITCLVKTRECCFSSPPNKVLDAQITSVVVWHLSALMAENTQTNSQVIISWTTVATLLLGKSGLCG